MYYIPYFPNDLRLPSQQVSITEEDKNELARLTLDSLKQDATMIRLMDQLVSHTSDQHFINVMNYTREIKARNMYQLDHLYRNIIGKTPEYQLDEEVIENSDHGIKTILERSIKGYEDNYKASLRTSRSILQQFHFQLSTVDRMVANELYNFLHSPEKGNNEVL